MSQYNFSNVNIGSGPNTGDGDPIRVSFDKINYNFSLIDLANLVYQGNLANGQNTVTSVAGRTGNVILGTADIVGLKTFVDSEITALVGNIAGNIELNLATVAYTGNYNDLNHKPTLVSQFINDAGYVTSLANYVTDVQLEANLALYTPTANLASVAFTGNYSSLHGTPSNVSAFTNDVGYITNVAVANTYATISSVNALALQVNQKADTTALANVAFSGQYSDLKNIPPAVGVPANVSAFYNDAGYITNANLAPYATTANVNAEIALVNSNVANVSAGVNANIATINSEITTINSEITLINANVSATNANVALKANISSLANVAFTGNYADLHGTPPLTGNISSLYNDVGYITNANLAPYDTTANVNAGLATKANISSLANVAFSGSYLDLTNVPPDVDLPIPANVSAFFNDVGYITNANLGPYATTANVNAELTLKANISSLANVAFTGNYADLHGTPILSGNVSSLTNDAGYITEANLAPYATTANVTTGFTAVYVALGTKVDTSALANIAFTGNYSDLKNIPPDVDPIVPTVLSAFTNDVGYITSASIPTNISAFTNDVGYVTGAALGSYATISSLANVAFSGSYLDLNHQPTLANVAHTGSYLDLINTPNVSVSANITIGTPVKGATVSIPTFTAPTATSVIIAMNAIQQTFSSTVDVPFEFMSNVPPAGTGVVYSGLTLADTVSPASHFTGSGAQFDIVVFNTNQPATLVLPNAVPFSTVTDVSITLLLQNINGIDIGGNGFTVGDTIAFPLSSVGATGIYATQNISVTLNSGMIGNVTQAPATALQWSNVVSDTDGFYNAITPTRLTIPNGVDKVRLKVLPRRQQIDIYKNGVLLYDNSTLPAYEVSGGFIGQIVTRVLDVVPGDYFEAFCYASTDLVPVTSTNIVFELEVVEGAVLDSSVDLLLANVAFTGNYSDLNGKPTIPTVPTTVSSFTNDAGYITEANLAPYATITSLANVAFSGNYADLNGKPTLDSAAGANTQIQFNVGGHLGASANLTFNDNQSTLTINPNINTGVATIAAKNQTQPTNLTLQAANNTAGGQGGSVVLQAGTGTPAGEVVVANEAFFNGNLFLQTSGTFISFSDHTIQTTAATATVAHTGSYTDLINLPNTPIIKPAPTTSIGQAGDIAGYIAYDLQYFYYCTGTYDGTTNIWRRIANDGTTW